MKARFLFVAIALAVGTGASLCWVAVSRRSTPATATEAADSALIQPSRIIYITNTVVRVKPLSWAALETPDYREFVRRCRGIGMPEDYIRAIVLTDLRGQLKPPARRFWESDSALARSGRLLAERASENRILGILEQLRLGTGDADEASEVLALLPTDARSALAQAIAPHDARIAELELRNADRLWAEDDLAAWNRAKVERVKAARQVLRPEQFLKWEAGLGEGLAERLRTLLGFEFSGEAEFMSVYSVEREIEEHSQAEDADLDSLDAEREQRLRTLLGEDRFKSYQKSSRDS